MLTWTSFGASPTSPCHADARHRTWPRSGSTSAKHWFELLTRVIEVTALVSVQATTAPLARRDCRTLAAALPLHCSHDLCDAGRSSLASVNVELAEPALASHSPRPL